MCPALSQVLCPGPALCPHSPVGLGSSGWDVAALPPLCKPGQGQCDSSLDTLYHFIFYSNVGVWRALQGSGWRHWFELAAPSRAQGASHRRVLQQHSSFRGCQLLLLLLRPLPACFSLEAAAGGPQIHTDKEVQGGLRRQSCGCRRLLAQCLLLCVSL